MNDSLVVRQLALGAVRWRAWSGDALDEARARGLPLLLFCGDGLDHWTAAMAAGIVADAQVCELIEQAFVPVAVDVAAAPGVARRVQETLALTADARGWPAIAFMTADARPFGAVPYRPIRDQEREKGLARILVEVAQRWRDARDDCVADAARVVDAITGMYASFAPDGRRFDPDLVLGNAEAQAMTIADVINGGFGPAPRHPNAPLIEFLIARCARPDPPLALTRQVERTLAAMAAGGLHDHLGGGFFRAATDETWTVPFFAKGRDENLALARVYERAARVFARDYYAEVAQCTRAFCASAFGEPPTAAGLHADSRGADGAVRDGAYSTWTRREIAAVIGSDGADLVCQRYGITDAGDLDDGRSVLAVRGDVDDEQAARLPALMQRLAVARAEREAPPLAPIVAVITEPALDPPPSFAVDGDAPRDPAEALALVRAHTGLLRRAPLACPGLCLALEELVVSQTWAQE